MTQTTRLGLRLLPGSLGIGLLGDGLLRATPWGLNVVLWIGALITGFWLLARRTEYAPAGEGRWLALPALLLAGGLAWRDSDTLRALDLCGLGCCLGVGLARTQAGSVRLAGFLEYFGVIIRSLFQTVTGGFPLLFRDIGWDTVPRGGWLPGVLAVGRGLVLVLPVLLLFGALLSAADAVYQRLVSQAFHFDLSALLGHFFLTLFLAWLTAGFGRALFWAGRMPPDASGRAWPALGPVETTTILGLLNLLFLSFVLVQGRYFFGGAATVAATAGLTYTQYARAGFFELAWVAALTLPLLLGLHTLQRPGDARAHRLFSAQAAVMVALLFVILASAGLRMRLYQQMFGLTELRLYTTAFMGWLAAVFAWFLWAVLLRGHRARFAFGSAVLAFVLVLGLHCVNPDALIVRTNAARAMSGTQPFDAGYAASLSADAVPALVDALPSLPPAAQAETAARLRPLWSQNTGDWRSWNWGRALAFHAVHSAYGN